MASKPNLEHSKSEYFKPEPGSASLFFLLLHLCCWWVVSLTFHCRLFLAGRCSQDEPSWRR